MLRAIIAILGMSKFVGGRYLQRREIFQGFTFVASGLEDPGALQCELEHRCGVACVFKPSQNRKKNAFRLIDEHLAGAFCTSYQRLLFDCHL